MDFAKEGDPQISSRAPRSRSDWVRIGCLAATVLALGGCALIIMPLGFDLGKTYLMRVYPRYFTEPLSLETVQYMCSMLDLANTDPRCQDDRTYAYEFFPQIRQRYPRMTDPALVDAELGRFQVGCEDPMESFSDGITRLCMYDLAGDGNYLISIRYSGGPADPREFTGVVWSVCTYAMQTKAVFVNFACNPPLAR